LLRSRAYLHQFFLECHCNWEWCGQVPAVTSPIPINLQYRLASYGYTEVGNVLLSKVSYENFEDVHEYLCCWYWKLGDYTPLSLYWSKCISHFHNYVGQTILAITIGPNCFNKKLSLVQKFGKKWVKKLSFEHVPSIIFWTWEFRASFRCTYFQHFEKFIVHLQGVWEKESKIIFLFPIRFNKTRII